MTDPTTLDRTDAWLAGLAQQFALGCDATNAACAGESVDPNLVVATCAAASLLELHADHATPAVRELLQHIATMCGQKALAQAWPNDADDVWLDPDTDVAERIDILRDVVETAAVFRYAPLQVKEHIQARLASLEAALATEPEAHQDLFDAIVLLGNVAAFRDRDHPVAAFLTFAREMTSPLAPEVDAAHASELAKQALAPLLANETAISATGSLAQQWFKVLFGWLKKTGGRIDDMLALAPPGTNVAYASSADTSNEARVTLVSSPKDEINAVFAGPDVLLEWQGEHGRVPTRLRIESTTDLEPNEAVTTIDGDRRVRWKLRVPPGESGTVVTLVFDDGTEQRLEMPAP
jgi:hypothetical protein